MPCYAQQLVVVGEEWNPGIWAAKVGMEANLGRAQVVLVEIAMARVNIKRKKENSWCIINQQYQQGLNDLEHGKF